MTGAVDLLLRPNPKHMMVLADCVSACPVVIDSGDVSDSPRPLFVGSASFRCVQPVCGRGGVWLWLDGPVCLVSACNSLSIALLRFLIDELMHMSQIQGLLEALKYVCSPRSLEAKNQHASSAQ